MINSFFLNGIASGLITADSDKEIGKSINRLSNINYWTETEKNDLHLNNNLSVVQL